MSDRPGIAEAGHHPVVQCGLKLAHVGLSQTTVVGNIWLGSHQDGTPSGRTGANIKLQVNKTISFQGRRTCLFWSFLTLHQQCVHLSRNGRSFHNSVG